MTQEEFKKKRASAERGVTQAMYELALAYKTGDSAKKILEQFFAWMRRAALAGHPDAMLDVAWAYADGEGVDCRHSVFFRVEEESRRSEQNPEAIFNLALAYKDGRGTDKNDQEFFKWIKKAAEGKHPEAMYHLATAYEEGIGTDRDLLQDFEWTKGIANLGEPGAMLRLAEAYKTGKGTPSNNEEFYKWTRKAEKAAEKAAKEPESVDTEIAFEDLPTARYNLALAYRDGTGTNRNKRLYFEWMKKSAEAVEMTIPIQKAVEKRESKREDELKREDIPKAMFKLALAYRDGEGTRRSKRHYYSWIEKAANFGLPEAMVELARIYGDGKIIDRDMTKYCEWMEKAARAGNSEGMYHFGLAYGAGAGRRYDNRQFLVDQGSCSGESSRRFHSSRHRRATANWFHW